MQQITLENKKLYIVFLGLVLLLNLDTLRKLSTTRCIVCDIPSFYFNILSPLVLIVAAELFPTIFGSLPNKVSSKFQILFNILVERTKLLLNNQRITTFFIRYSRFAVFEDCCGGPHPATSWDYPKSPK